MTTTNNPFIASVSDQSGEVVILEVKAAQENPMDAFEALDRMENLYPEFDEYYDTCRDTLNALTSQVQKLQAERDDLQGALVVTRADRDKYREMYIDSRRAALTKDNTDNG